MRNVGSGSVRWLIIPQCADVPPTQVNNRLCLTYRTFKNSDNDNIVQKKKKLKFSKLGKHIPRNCGVKLSYSWWSAQ